MPNANRETLHYWKQRVYKALQLTHKLTTDMSHVTDVAVMHAEDAVMQDWLRLEEHQHKVNRVLTALAHQAPSDHAALARQLLRVVHDETLLEHVLAQFFKNHDNEERAARLLQQANTLIHQCVQDELEAERLAA